MLGAFKGLFTQRISEKQSIQTPSERPGSPAAKQADCAYDAATTDNLALSDGPDAGARFCQALAAEERRFRSKLGIRDALKPFVLPGGTLPESMTQQVASLECAIDLQVRGTTLDDLPPELIHSIFMNLGTKDIVALGACNKTLRRASREDSLWESQRLQKLSLLAFDRLPSDIKHFAEVRATNWMMQMKTLNIPEALPRYKTRGHHVLIHDFPEREALTAATLGVMDEEYLSLARRLIASLSATLSGQFRPSCALRDALRTCYLQKDSSLRAWRNEYNCGTAYVTSEDILSVATSLLSYCGQVRLVTDDSLAVRVIRSKLNEPAPDMWARALWPKIDVFWLRQSDGETKRLKGPKLAIPQDSSW